MCVGFFEGKKGLFRNLFLVFGLLPSRRPPYLTRRYRYRGRRQMIKALGPDLSAKTTWAASDEQTPEGELASIFAAPDNIHKWVHYLPVYESVLSPLRSRPIQILEIGVAR